MDLTTEQLKKELEKRGYYTKNLWHVDDVIGREGFDGGEKESQEVLDNVLTNECLMTQINDDIDMEIDFY